uniref:Uncharacterized protein n=1 Tax=Anguilla anguilla TaxID=7936 RepID=A0A0E9V6P3_ANGAN
MKPDALLRVLLLLNLSSRSAHVIRSVPCYFAQSNLLQHKTHTKA